MPVAGVAVLSVMLVTTVLVSLVMLVVWEKPLALVLPFFLFFFIFEGVYFTANIRKARTHAHALFRMVWDFSWPIICDPCSQGRYILPRC